jgi:hypothetical protein
VASVTPFVQVGTYPTRNFATLGPFIMFRSMRHRIDRGTTRFGTRPPPAYRYADRTISSARLGSSAARRIVSEDSPGNHREPFLLIVRTLQIITAAKAASTEGFSEFPAYSQVYLRNYNYGHHQLKPCSACLPSSSIVTAAVYRGFDQELCLAADPIN